MEGVLPQETSTAWWSMNEGLFIEDAALGTKR
jgi:hypothetical protein